ncbi:UDP-N-acetylmuramoyl-L-alanine--D-glutamate ligase [Hydrogenovibrio sp. JE_KL2]|uniref:UDP-N-acetylmuramoyl-L-alanine--D-glutamate ligase n=1 Tax=Hydrogenovibrio sp. JE_KL2 TaxID=2651188 RepID=UPI001355F4AB|nr:UDP-N-acetylmuramoyl-L-alanine--D-glutamate ligase [Hydrogenovibrio sp. JE_KL2]
MHLVVGLGITGKSVLHYLLSQGEECLAFDTREGFDLTVLQIEFPSVQFACGQLPVEWVSQVSAVVISPGVATSEPWLDVFHQAGVPIIGDIELFARAVGKPVVAITGSNGKSTVTTLTAQVLAEAGYRVGLGGNIGVPALDLLRSGQGFDVFVLELSSFQLETTYSLQPTSATVLNVSEDHMDRYTGLEDYLQAKMTILNNTQWSILPFDLADSPSSDPSHALHFGLRQATDGRPVPLADTQYGLIEKDGVDCLGYNHTPLLKVESMALKGEHHQLNALATMALCRPFNVSPQNYERVFAAFTGLPHRTQLVMEEEGIQWINDSKGTNVGATQTAIKSFAKQTKDSGGQVILIAGGVGKEADFSLMAEDVQNACRSVILFGRDKDIIRNALIPKVMDAKMHLVDDLAQAVNLARETAEKGDVVLFSPACASFDQFANYMERGDVFEKLVKQLFE